MVAAICGVILLATVKPSNNSGSCTGCDAQSAQISQAFFSAANAVQSFNK